MTGVLQKVDSQKWAKGWLVIRWPATPGGNEVGEQKLIHSPETGSQYFHNQKTQSQYFQTLEIQCKLSGRDCGRWNSVDGSRMSGKSGHVHRVSGSWTGPKEVLLTVTVESGAQLESAGGVDNIAGVERITGWNWPQVTSKGTGEVSATVERHAVGSSEFSWVAKGSLWLWMLPSTPDT